MTAERKPSPFRCETCKFLVDARARVGYKKCEISNHLMDSDCRISEHIGIVGCASHSDIFRISKKWKPHKTVAEKKCKIRYEDCNRKYACENAEECWYDSEEYYYDCGAGS